MTESKKQEEEDANKNKSEEYNGGKFKKDTEGECNLQTGQIKENKKSTSKCLIQEGKYADYHVQQRMQESTMDASKDVDLTNMSLEENKRKSCKKMIQNEGSKNYNEIKIKKEQQVSFVEERLEKQQQQQQQDDIKDDVELKLITSDDILLKNEGKAGKDQVNTIHEILPNKQKRKNVVGEFDSLIEHSQEDNIDDNDEDDHLNKGTSSESTIFKSLFDLCEVIVKHETYEEHDKNMSRKDQEEPIEGEQSEEKQQKQQPNDNTGEPELNKVTGEDSLPNINPDHVLNDNDANCGSKLLKRDTNGGNYSITQGIPRSIKFCFISNLYKCTTRLSSHEDEYNWNIPRGEDST